MSFFRKMFFEDAAPSAPADEDYAPVDTTELDAIIKKPVVPVPSKATPAPATPPKALPTTTAPINKDNIYDGVPTVAFTAEQLLKVLEGLGALPEDQRKVAITALDAADDRWDLPSVIQDAERKIAALDTAIDKANRKLVADELRQKNADAAAEKTVAEALAEIDAQIAALQKEREEAQEIARADKAAREQAAAALIADAAEFTKSCQEKQEQLRRILRLGDK
jgi:hypothetical protein